ncbi:DDE_3 domain-containing protein [Trichonephila clavipes]|nr:DDE_3 domain-containing protein [Trichonephila clavipes]
MNPIEHVWDMLDRRISARQPPPTYLSDLRRALLDEWCNIPQDQIDNLILNMPRRYKQDGGTCQTSRESMEILTEIFDDRVISKGLWPPRLPDLQIQDFFLWGYLKNATFRNNPHTLDEL